MRVTWYPRNILLVVALLGLLAFALRLAIDFRTGSVVGLLALLSYIGVDAGFSFNPRVRSRAKALSVSRRATTLRVEQ